MDRDAFRRERDALGFDRVRDYAGRHLSPHLVLYICPSSKHLGRMSLFRNKGSGSSRFDVKPLGVDGSSLAYPVNTLTHNM